ncbi:MAG: lamin tail domain-containing protein [Candidatus Latescibacteria bacterium]|nr:lamin tail domain-containing protein [Candidatus Latescibacterota bacterium]
MNDLALTLRRGCLILAGLLFLLPAGAPAQVYITEILADPPNELAGDANGDGVRDSSADEFVELYNAGADTLSLSGWRLSDDDTTPARSFVFPAWARLEPGGYLVLFGGGAPTGFTMPVFVDDGRIGDGLTNSGDTVFLIDARGDTADVVHGHDWPADRAAARNPAGVFVAHGDPPGQGEAYSPGRAGLIAPPPPPPHLPGRSPFTAVVVSEVLADPPDDLAGDTNGDGVRDSFADEFVELYNTGPDTLSLAGWVLGDDDAAPAACFHFPAGTRLAPGAYLVLFGGGAPTSFAVPAFADDGRIGDGLSNTGDTVLLFDALGDTVAVVQGQDWPADRSVVRFPEGTGDFVPHDTPPGAGEPCSPGRARTLATPPPAEPLPAAPPPLIHLSPVQLIVAEILADPPGDINGDGRADRNEDEFVELFNPGPDLDLSGWRLSDDDTPPERQFHFPAGSLLPRGQRLVLFGGGAAPRTEGLAFADDGTLGDGLANAGDRLLLIGGPAADTLLSFTYTSKPDLNQSLACEEGPCQPHGQLPGRASSSPGGPRLLYTGFRLDSLRLETDQSAALALRGEFPGGSEPIDPSRVLWHVEDRRVIQVDRDGIARGLRPGRTTVDAWTPEVFLASTWAQVLPPPPPPPPPNQAPRFVAAPDTQAYAGSHYHCTLLAEDPEHSTLLYTPTLLPAWLQWEPLTRTLQGQAPPEPGSAQIAVEADDGQGGLAVLRFALHVVPLPAIRFSEVLSDPPPGLAGDANGDGQRHSQTDEFIELYHNGPDSLDLSGCLLAGEKGSTLFRFPAGTRLPAGARAVVFGDDPPEEPYYFSAGGRLGQGLNNRQGVLCLIDPAGPDTLARAAYYLERDPDQSLCWLPGHDEPVLHGQWPGRDLHSPGKPRPQLQTLSLDPPRLLLVAGEQAQLKVVGRYSDGLQQELAGTGQWRSTATSVAPLRGQGLVAAADTGHARVWVQFDTFAASCQVAVQYPLSRRLEFSPSWERLAAPAGLPLTFAVRSLAGEPLACTWSVNGRPQPNRAQQLVRCAPTRQPDTLEVEVRVRRETYTRRWLLQPGSAAQRADTLIITGPLRPRAHPNPFNSSTQIRFQLAAPSQAPTLCLYDLAGQQVRQLEVEAEGAGWHHTTWDGLDAEGRPAASGIYLYTIEGGAQRQLGKLLLLR